MIVKSPKLFFSIAGLLSLAPLIMIGWWSLLGHPDPTSQKGNLIQNAVFVETSKSSEPVWLLGQLSNTMCNDECKGRMFLLERIRLAMGKNQRRVSVALITPKQESIDQYDNLVIKNFSSIRNEVQNDALVVVDPQGRVVMSYSKDVDPRNITSDLKKLLKFSRIG
ncbi:MAG: hypothetical protein CMF41_03395 [Legionellales bacterium]|nr:hypothetical protein [Legionellales bacterium]OUX65331.1 MAG: hypothetical protein CBE41_01810 [Gammaproteobacteria bacterium TMED281]|tara:strand:+ start:654 stop:1151 length:498 start_codon:yes stop_codon:yes gene_type:complete